MGEEYIIPDTQIELGENNSFCWTIDEHVLAFGHHVKLSYDGSRGRYGVMNGEGATLPEAIIDVVNNIKRKFLE